jgi:hypothetical protein
LSKAIATFLGVEPTPIENLPAIVDRETGVAQDATTARNNLRRLMETATEALKNALDVAVQSESPRAYEVVANLLSTAADLNTRLLDTHTTESKLTTTQNTQNNTSNTTNNVVFTGTSVELSNLLKTL